MQAINRSSLLSKCRYTVGRARPAAAATCDIVVVVQPCRVKSSWAAERSRSRFSLAPAARTDDSYRRGIRSRMVISVYEEYSEIMRISTELGELAARVVPGPPQVAVLWHSMFTDSRSWDRVVDDLREQRTLVLVDGWSFGASADLGRVVPDFVDACVRGAVAVVSQVQNELAAGPVDWLGSAWGGHVGLQLAAVRSELVRSLITVGTPVHAASPSMRRQVRMLL